MPKKSWVIEQRLNPSGRIIEQIIRANLDPDDVLALLPDLPDLIGDIRHVSITVQFLQQLDGTGSVKGYRPDHARAYITAGEPR